MILGVWKALRMVMAGLTCIAPAIAAGPSNQDTPLRRELLQAEDLRREARRYMEQDRLQDSEATHLKALELYESSSSAQGIALTALDLGTIYVETGEFSKGERRLKQALAILSNLPGREDRYAEAVARHNLTSIYLATGRSAEAVNEARATIRLGQILRDPASQVAALNLLASALGDQGDDLGMLAALNEARALQKGLPSNPRMESDILHNLANVHFRQGQYSQSLEFLQQAWTLRRELRPGRREKELQEGIGLAQLALGHLDEATASFEKAADIARRAANKAWEFKAQLGLATVHIKKEEYQSALKIYLEWLPFAEGNFDPSIKATVHDLLGATYAQLGELAKAERHVTQSVTLWREIGNPEELVSALGNLASLYSDLVDLERASVALDEAVGILRGLNRPAALSRLLGQAALLAMQRRDCAAAMKNARQALDLSDSLESQVERESILLMFGFLYIELGDYQKSLDIATRWEKIADQAGIFTGRVEDQMLFVLAHFLQGNRKLALVHLRRAVDLLERQGGAITVSELKSRFLETRFDVFILGVWLSVFENQAEDAFRYAEQARARAFLDGISNQRIDIHRRSDHGLLRQEQYLRQRLTFLRERWREMERSINAQSQVEAQRVSGELDEVRNEYSTLLVRLKLMNPEYTSLIGANTLGLQQIQPGCCKIWAR